MKQIVKNWIFPLAIIGVLFMLAGSCKKDKDETPAPLSVSGTTWDILVVYDTTTSWHADITFNADGTSKYDEPSDPGAYLSYGTWTLTNNKIHFSIGLDPNYIFDGTVVGNTVSGTYIFGAGTKVWSGVKR